MKKMMRNRHCLIALLIVALAGSLGASAYGKQKIKVIKEKPKKQQKKAADTDTGAVAAEPDKILYDRAVNSMKHSKYTEARLELQTLINTYPDSEYLAKAKLAIADSFYKEGGVANLTEAIDAYKSFIVFFPFLDEAQYAQMQVAMCHYHMMLKSDRDTTEAESAESEFQNFLLKYPQSPLIANVNQDLRNVQEVIADGEYKIGRFYYLKPDYPAAAARLMEVAERYPLYSNSDDALWMLGDIYMIAKKYSKSEDDKNHWADYAAKCYTRIARDYPLSSHAADARAQLKSMGMPVPSADPHALARMQQDQRFEKKHHEVFAMRWPKEIILSRPDTMQAAQTGEPNMSPPDDAISATDVLKRNAPGPMFTLAAAPQPAANSDSGGDAVPINAEPQTQSGDAPTTGVGAQIISTGGSDTNGDSTQAAPASTTPPAAAPADAPAGPSVLAPVGADSGANTLDNSATPTAAGAGNSSDPAPATPGGAAAPAASAATAAGPTQAAGSSSSSSAAKPAAQPKAPKADSKTESSSKKKHGLHKVVPW